MKKIKDGALKFIANTAKKSAITAANRWTTKMKPKWKGDITVFYVSACSSSICMANGIIRFDNL